MDIPAGFNFSLVPTLWGFNKLVVTSKQEVPMTRKEHVWLQNTKKSTQKKKICVFCILILLTEYCVYYSVNTRTPSLWRRNLNTKKILLNLWWMLNLLTQLIKITVIATESTPETEANKSWEDNHKCDKTSVVKYEISFFFFFCWSIWCKRSANGQTRLVHTNANLLAVAVYHSLHG